MATTVNPQKKEFRLSFRVGNSVVAATLVSLNVSGPTSISEGSFGNFSVTGTYSDGKTLPVNDAVGTVNAVGVSIQGYKVTVDTNAVTGDTRTIPVSFAKAGISKSVNLSIVDTTVVTPPTTANFISRATKSAQPGEAVNITGEFGLNAKVYMNTLNNPTPVYLPAATNGSVTMKLVRNQTVVIPSSRPMDVFRLWVEDNGVVSNAVLVNQARAQFLNCDVASKGATVQLVGKNLQLTPGLVKISFVPVGGGTTIDGTSLLNIQKSTARRLQFTIPTSGPAVNTVYKILVENGYGPAVVCDETITILGTGADSFGIGDRVPWAGKFDFAAKTFNAVNRQNNQFDVVLPQAASTAAADNSTAINANIQYLASQGGAVLTFPAGDYWIQNPIQMASNVILKGPGKIRITGNVPGGSEKWAFYFPNGTSRSGLVDVLYSNGAKADDYQGYGNMLGQDCSDILLKGCVFDQGQSDWLQMYEGRRIALLGNRLNQGINRNSRPYARGPLRLDGSQYVVCDGNYFDYCVDGVNAIGTKNIFWSANTFFWEASLGNREDPVNHVLIQGHSDKWCVFGKNRFTSDEAFEINKDMKVLKITGKSSNDGEKIIAEFTGEILQKVRACPVLSATSTTVNYASMYMPADDHYYVSVIAGKGLGQERKVKSRTNTQVVLDEAWDTIPDATSNIVIHVSGVNEFLIEDNDFDLGKRGPTLYLTPLRDGAIVNNRMNGAGSIDNTPFLQSVEQSNQWLFCSQWGMVVENNTITCENDPYNGNFIGIHAVQSRQDRTVGALVLDYVCRNNTVIAHQPNVNAVVDTDYPNGFINQCEWQPDGRPFVGDKPAVIGSIFENNTVKNCNSPLKMGWVHNTYVKNMTVINGGTSFVDDGLGQNLPSVNTLRVTI